jgi:isoleucyl-tRNA synthetase
MDNYDLPGATYEIKGFIDALNNWYIRRSRDRFWSPSEPVHDKGKQEAYDTLFTTLETLCRLLAPFLPMISEEIFRGLTKETSVHETEWPSVADFPSDTGLVVTMDSIRDIVSATLRLREDAGLRVRLPLRSVTIAGLDSDSITDFEWLIKDEVNVKSLVFTDDLETYGSFALKPDGKVLGPRLGGDVQNVFRSAKNGDWEQLDDGRVRINDHILELNEFDLSLLANDGTTAASLPGNKAIVVLDTEITDDLLIEGKARDAIRAIQEARKSLDLVLTDRIHVKVDASIETSKAIKAFSNYICEQVLAKSIIFNEATSELESFLGLIDGEEIRIQIEVD